MQHVDYELLPIRKIRAARGGCSPGSQGIPIGPASPRLWTLGLRHASDTPRPPPFDSRMQASFTKAR
jgi:hypothetical protein